MTLDGFTTDQLTAMSDAAADAACDYYARATALVGLSARIPLHDKEAFDASQAEWRALMAAGNEQEELCQAIGDEIRMRSVCDA